MSQFNLGWIPLIQQELRKFFASKGQGDKADTALQPGAIGSTVQAYDDDLQAIAALTTTGLIDRTGAGTATTRATGATGLAVLASADASAARTAIGSPAFAGDSTATITTNSVVRSQIDNSGNVSSTIPGGSTLLPEFKCRAWVNFDGSVTPPNIRGSGNVSSVTRIGTGGFTVNFSTPMPNVNFGAVAWSNALSGESNFTYSEISLMTTSAVTIQSVNTQGSGRNVSFISLAVFR